MAKKVKEVEKTQVKLVKFSMKAVIPTGAYANIQPEFEVLAENIEGAVEYVLPHVDKLFAHYLNRGDNPEKYGLKPVSDVVMVRTTKEGLKAGAPLTKASESSPVPKDASPAYLKALNAVQSCMSVDALEVVQGQISKSIKLDGDEKTVLYREVLLKGKELNK